MKRTMTLTKTGGGLAAHTARELFRTRVGLPLLQTADEFCAGVDEMLTGDPLGGFIVSRLDSTKDRRVLVPYDLRHRGVIAHHLGHDAPDVVIEGLQHFADDRISRDFANETMKADIGIDQPHQRPAFQSLTGVFHHSGTGEPCRSGTVQGGQARCESLQLSPHLIKIADLVNIESGDKKAPARGVAYDAVIAQKKKRLLHRLPRYPIGSGELVLDQTRTSLQPPLGYVRENRVIDKLDELLARLGAWRRGSVVH